MTRRKIAITVLLDSYLAIAKSRIQGETILGLTLLPMHATRD